MKILRSIAALREWRASFPSKDSLGFVPTMGALHAAHLELVERARRENRCSLVSIFVNPTQFGPKEDFSHYPRPFANDVRLLKSVGADALFSPVKDAMYTPSHATEVRVQRLTDNLCGSPKSRGPAHFIGVATVVAKLLNLARPTRAYFGMKDFQQLRVIEQMNVDLNLGVSIVRCPTKREPDGLAISSRNAYLSSMERLEAPRLYDALQYGRKLLRSRPQMSPRAVCDKLSLLLRAHPAFKIDYIQMVDPVTLQQLTSSRRPALLAAAVFLGRTRLIDNLLVR